MNRQARMDISKGFQLEQPHTFVPWETSEVQIQPLFDGLPLRRVTHGYFTIPCVSPGGLSHELGFHFYPRGGGILIELEFFRTPAPDLAASYEKFQQHLEATFGLPALTAPGSEGFLSHKWRLPSADIVLNRFGPEEHVRIGKGV